MGSIGRMVFFFGADRSGADRSGADRSGADRSGADRSGAGGGENIKAGVKFHGVKPPQAARYALSIDHEGVRIKAHLAGRFGPSSFVLTGE